LQIISLDASAFPEIRARILLLDPNGSTAAAPTRQSLTLSENNVSVDFSVEQEESGAEIGFVLDAGMGLYNSGASGRTRLVEMKEAVLELTQDPLLLTGKDVFYVVAQEPRGHAVLVNPDTPATQISTVLGQYNPQITYQYAYPLEGVSALLDWFAQEKSAGNGRARAIVVLSGSMPLDRKYPLSSVAGKAGQMGIPVHTVMVRHSMAEEQSLRDLAEQTGGLFTYCGPECASNLAGLKTRLLGLRRQYILAYRSPNSDSGTRVVSIGIPYAESGKPVLGQYDITVEPPVAVIRSPGEDQTVSPQTYKPTEDPQATPATGIIVSASVSWPDGHPRKIQRATLLANGKPQSVLNAPNDSMTFVWIPGSKEPSGPVTMQIQIEDELGLVGLSDQIVVRIEFGSGFSFCRPGSHSPLCSLSLPSLLPYLSILIALTALGLVVVFRKQLAGTAQQAAGAAAELIQEVGETLRFKHRPGSVRATLMDMDGNTGTGRSSFELFGTTSIGRSKQNADLVFQAGQPESPISRLHCTILEEDGAFFLRDDQSANGTYLNGSRLAPMERNPLKDGDEIQLADPRRNGVRLEFRAPGEGGPGSGGAATESTNRMSRN